MTLALIAGVCKDAWENHLLSPVLLQGGTPTVTFAPLNGARPITQALAKQRCIGLPFEVRVPANATGICGVIVLALDHVLWAAVVEAEDFVI